MGENARVPFLNRGAWKIGCGIPEHKEVVCSVQRLGGRGSNTLKMGAEGMCVVTRRLVQ